MQYVAMAKQPDLYKTPFYQHHLQGGAKIVDFAGYAMPVQYHQGIIDEHLHTRTHAGLFDVSHMGQIVVKGSAAQHELEKLMPVDLDALAINHQAYTFFTTEQGTILDDLIISRWDDETFCLVVNGACKQGDFDHLKAHLSGVDISLMHNQGLLALQGPKARDVMTALAPQVINLSFMQGMAVTIDAADCYITCSGYTGEDGFEISVKSQDCQKIAKLLLSNQEVQWIGLGARDSLRLEAGLCLYGHDIDLYTSPVEAGIAWSISPSRRQGGSKQGGFLGADSILPQIANGVTKKRVVFEVDGRAPVREGADIMDQSDNLIGVITSGGFSPSLQKPIAMGYVDPKFAKTGTALNALVRGRPRAIKVTTMPLVPHRYYRG